MSDRKPLSPDAATNSALMSLLDDLRGTPTAGPASVATLGVEEPAAREFRVRESHEAFKQALALGSALGTLTLPELRERICAYVTLQFSSRECGATLRDLNRRFGVAAARHGSTVALLVKEAADACLLTGTKYQKQTVVLPYSATAAHPETLDKILARTVR